MMCCILKDSFFSLFFGRSKLQHHHWSNKCRTSHTWCNQSNKNMKKKMWIIIASKPNKICFDFDYSIFVLFLVIKFKKRDMMMMLMMKFDDHHHWMVSMRRWKSMEEKIRKLLWWWWWSSSSSSSCLYIVCFRRWCVGFFLSLSSFSWW